jgi:hypothetical protein
VKRRRKSLVEKNKLLIISFSEWMKKSIFWGVFVQRDDIDTGYKGRRESEAKKRAG